MFTLSDYTVLSKIYQGSRSVTYRATRKKDKLDCVLKLLSAQYPSMQDINRLLHEYSINKQINSDKIIQAIDLTKFQNGFILVKENMDGLSLKELLEKQHLNLLDFLEIFKQISESIKQIHQVGIIHNDINPSNIIVHTDPLLVKITDFGLSISTRDKTEAITLESYFGTLYYMSPEQTGRTSHHLDTRSDLYSLGVTAYEMATGHLPFEGDDPVEIMNAHLAKNPIPPQEINPDIPKVVSDIILKLLHKLPEERYQSAEGLIEDIETCIHQLNTTQTIHPFPLAEKDSKTTLNWQTKLYGRTKPIQLINQGLDRVYQGSAECFLIDGEQGVGKTKFLQEIKVQALKRHAYVLFGKFDLFQQSNPYSGFIQPIKDLVKQVLSETEHQLKLDTVQLQKIVGANGQILTDFIPDIQLILGPQPPIENISLSEVQHQFLYLLHQFIKYFSSPSHPLIICLDDLHYADLSSLKLIDSILRDKTIHHLMIIGSFRRQELTLNQPLQLMITQLKESDVMINDLILSPLSINETQSLLLDIFNQNINQAIELTQLLFKKTDGNPFFIHELLKNLYQKNLIYYDKKNQSWASDIYKIQVIIPSSNVLSLMISHIQDMTKAKKIVLQVASCFGSVFNLDLIATLTQLSLKEISGIINAAIRENLIIPEPTKNQFKFSHDSLQESLYHSIELNRRNEIHHQLGHLLLKGLNLKKDFDVNRLFDALNHLNKNDRHIIDIEKRYDLASLNVIAGIKAKQAAGFNAAYGYLHTASRLLADSTWPEDYQILFNLYKELAETEFILGKYEDADSHFSLLLKHAKSNIDKAEIYSIKILLYTCNGKHQETVHLFYEALQLFNIKQPKYWLNLNSQWLYLKLKILGRNLPNVVRRLPSNQDPSYLSLTKILAYASNALMITNPKLSVYYSYFNCLLTIKYGHTVYSSSLFFHSIIHFISIKKNPDIIKQFIEAATLLENSYQDQQIIAKNRIQLAFLGGHYFYPFEQCLEWLISNYPICMAAGDMIHAGYSKAYAVRLLLTMGRPLNQVSEAAQDGIRFFQVNHDQSFEQVMHFIQDFIRCVSEKPEQSFENITLEHYLHQLPPSPWHSFRKLFYGMKALYFYCFNKPSEALEMTLEWKKYESFSSLIVSDIDEKLIHSLILIENYPFQNPSVQKKWRKSLLEILVTFKKCASLTPHNFDHKYLFLLAELKRLDKDDEYALFYYDKAIEDTKQSGILHIEALVNERAAQLCLEMNKMNLGGIYLQEAYFTYFQWNCHLKLKQLDAKYPLLIKSNPTDVYEFVSSSSKDYSIDILATVKAIQTISSEMDIQQLLKKVMGIMIEIGGAERGFYISSRQNKLTIEAYGNNKNEVVLTEEHLQDTILPVSVITYVQRSREPVVIAEALADQQFGIDPYVVNHKIKSIICLPAIYQQQLIAILYLENNLISGAFTSPIMKVLNILIGQFSISIENARLYTASNRFVPSQYLGYLNKRNITEVTIGDQTQKEMSILFCDIRNYTALSEKLSPKETFLFINHFLDYMEPNIRKNQGFIDKYIGDAIMALFPDPASCLHAAIGMIKSLKSFNQMYAKGLKFPISVGIGINTGSIILGMVGNKERMEGTVIGDEVNIAARIENLTKRYGVALLMSDATKKMIEDEDSDSIRLIDNILVRGRSKPISIWEVFSIDEENELHLKTKTLSTFDEARQHYLNGNYPMARSLFNEVLSINPKDTVARYYLTHYLKSKLS